MGQAETKPAAKLGPRPPPGDAPEENRIKKAQQQGSPIAAGAPTTNAPQNGAGYNAPAPVPTASSSAQSNSGAAAAPARPADEKLGTGAKMNSHLTVADFELLKVVGKGSFGKVMQVRKKDSGKIYAMKVLKKQHLVARKQVAHTQTERKVLENIDHPFIVSLRFAFQTPEKLYMVLDYFTGGELFFHLKSTGRFKESRAKFYAAEIISALQCLHQHNIVYRDLKPENVLLDEQGHIRLTDFGLSKESVTGTNLTHTFCGTPEYLAPEVIHGSGYGKPVDWWSLGTLLYEMLTGLPPFYNQNLHVMYEKIIRAKLTFPEYLSEPAKDLLRRLLDRNPATRLGSGPTDAEEIMGHPFFSEIDWDLLNRRQIEPPFKPDVTEGDMDTTYVDDEFKNEEAKDTPAVPSKLNQNAKVVFPNFTYVAPASHMSRSLLDESASGMESNE